MEAKLNEFLSQFRDQYIDSNEIELNLDIDFRSIESYDSLTGMALLVMIQDNYDLNITEDQWKELHTVEEVYNYIQEHSNK